MTEPTDKTLLEEQAAAPAKKRAPRPAASTTAAPRKKKAAPAKKKEPELELTESTLTIIENATPSPKAVKTVPAKRKTTPVEKPAPVEKSAPVEESAPVAESAPARKIEEQTPPVSQPAPAASTPPPVNSDPAPAPTPTPVPIVPVPTPSASEWSPGASTEPVRSPEPAPAYRQQPQQQSNHQQPRHYRDHRDHRDNRRDQRDSHRDQPRDDRDQAPRDPQQQQNNDAPRPEPIPPAPPAPPVYGEGIIEVSGKGFGFLRDPKRNFVQNPQDIFVTPEVVRRYSLRDGMWIKGEIRRGNRGPQLFRLTEVNGGDPEKCRNLPTFDELTVISPNQRIKLETVPERYTTRVMDMMTPVGKGQRGLIVAPPRTGKTTLLQHIADAVVKNHPEMKLIILLVDERPEEVTEIRRTVPAAEIMASSNDSDLKSHTRIAQLAIERARRLVESGQHVFVLLDSITRVGRAFNNSMGGGGRTMSGGIDARALEIPRKLFASARNTEEAGSLTIVATALIETGSRMDELIFQEFKGTGNMELVLDRKISDLRIYPAVDIFKSGTRREELLLPEEDLHKINVIRRGLAGHKPEEAIERLLSFLKKFPTNSIMLREIPG
ncbi:MAG: transcription termination factor Rho [Chthoniobacteraceae bacterium]